MMSTVSCPAETPLPATRQRLLQPWVFAVFLLAALILRVATFGDPNLHGDEDFYQTVGIAMHHGAIPYVDVWDRKPWGLFFLYYLIAFISEGPLAYQVIATTFAAGTAWVIGRLASTWTKRRGGFLAGLVYLLWLNKLHGFGGQSPVFYNLLMATAALLVFRAIDRLRSGDVPATVPLAMLLAGMAITIKQTALFEACFFGIYASVALMRSPMSPRRVLAHALGWASIGAAPILAISAWFAVHGYWAIYWQAMVLASADRPMTMFSTAGRFLVSFAIVTPILMTITMSLATWQGISRRFVTWWLLAAFIGLAAVPNFYMHYSLPILVPLSVATAVFLSRPIAGPITIACLAIYAIHDSDTFVFDRTRQSQHAFAQLTDTIRRHDDGSPLFVVDGPSQLYPMTGHAFPTPLVFPTHLGDANEKDLSHLSTIGETRRVLALRPGIVVMPDTPREGPPNMEVIGAVTAYVHQHCRRAATVETPDFLTSARMDVWVDCRRKR